MPLKAPRSSSIHPCQSPVFRVPKSPIPNRCSRQTACSIRNHRYSTRTITRTVYTPILERPRDRPIAPPKRRSPELEAAWKRFRFAGFGLLSTTLALFGVLYFDVFGVPLDEKRTQPKTKILADAPPVATGAYKKPQHEEDDVVETGTSTIPTFPRHIRLGKMDAAQGASYVDTGEQEYQLMGLGIRTVSFLGIQVYVVGLYIAVPDIERLQHHLVRTVNNVATALVPGEKTQLKESLLDPVQGEEIWGNILKDAGIRTAIRIVPTRNTDFQHLRDGWVRGITSRVQKASTGGPGGDYSDDAFGKSMSDFKGIWGGGVRKGVPKGETLLLTRDAKGTLDAWVTDKNGETSKIGQVDDERISRLIWLGYLAGKAVSSESARKNVVDGVMEYVERPAGTVATQVV